MESPDPIPTHAPGPIWPPDWSQFIPDAIGAIITGAIIGFVLWRIETRAEAGRARIEAEARWKINRAGLGPLMRPELDSRTHGNVDEYPRQWEVFLSALDSDVVVWANDAPKNAELQMARAMLVDLPLIERLVSEVKNEVGGALVARGLALPANASKPANYTLVRLLEGDDAAIPYFGDIPNPDPTLAGLYDEALNDVGIRRKATTLTAVNTRAAVNWVRLRQSLLRADS